MNEPLDGVWQLYDAVGFDTEVSVDNVVYVDAKRTSCENNAQEEDDDDDETGVD